MSSPPQRLGLFGGSFNPVHLGHLLVAQAACEEMRLTRLFFILASLSPFKPATQPAPPAHRLCLLRLALAGRNDFEVDEQEIRRGGISYSIDTVRDYARRFPGAELFYLIGADHLMQLPQWKDAAELARLAQFVIIPRPGESLGSLPPPFQGQALKGFPVGISSSQIRERVRAGLSLENFVPSAVAEAIRNYQLYF